MPYTHLVEPGVSSPERIAFHVPVGMTEREVAEASYSILRENGQLELVVDDWFAGIMTMANVLPLLLTMDNAVRGRRSASRRSRGAAAQVTRFRCPVCSAIAYGVGPGIARCREAGHGSMVPLSA